MKPKMMKLSQLVLDFNLYPRHEVDSQTVSAMRQSLAADETLPPILVDAKSKRVVDGFHRVTAHKGQGGDDATIAVILKAYKNEAAMFRDAMTLNARHGRPLTPYDRARCIELARTFNLAEDEVASCLAITRAKYDQIVDFKTALLNGKARPIKRTLRHLAGTSLSKRQDLGNKRAGGMPQLYYVNQVINLIENDILDRSNEALMDALAKLQTVLRKAAKGKRAAE